MQNGEWQTPQGLAKLVGKNVDVQLSDGRRAFGHLVTYDPDLMTVTLSREDKGLLINTYFPISMARDVQTR
jgi:hypothetical protein